MYRRANAGHVGSSLSCAEILVFLKLAWMREDDRLILSKGHAAAALYSLLAEVGRLSGSQIESYYEEGTHLPALPPFNTIKEIPFATGSLGHGLSLSAGMALAARLDGMDRRVFCVTSDGELDEGSVWEAALFVRIIIWTTWCGSSIATGFRGLVVPKMSSRSNHSMQAARLRFSRCYRRGPRFQFALGCAG